MAKFLPLVFCIIFVASCKSTNTTEAVSAAKDTVSFIVDGKGYFFPTTGSLKDSAGQTTITIPCSNTTGLYATITLFDLYKKAGFFDIGALKQNGDIINGITMTLEYKNGSGYDPIYSTSLVPGGDYAGTMIISEGFESSLKATFSAKLPKISGSGNDTTVVTGGTIDIEIR